jgi:hypothetical protein
VRGQTRNLVALLKREQFTEAFARNGVTAGSFQTTNSGNKTFIETPGSQVVVRCMTVGSASECTKFTKAIQVPGTIVHDAATPPAMTATQLLRFKAVAQSASPSTYYTACPASLTGTVVFIDLPNDTASCDYNNGTYNSPAEPGIVIMPRGTLSTKATHYGLLYMANAQNASTAVLTLAAGAEIIGGVAVDGPGQLLVGAASGGRATITFDPNAFNSLASYGTTGLVQNTWRELPPN